MSSSVSRVRQALHSAGIEPEIRETDRSTRTAQEAATTLGVVVDQIAKSIILQSADGEGLFLFLTAGSNRVDLDKAAALVGTALVQARADVVRQRTGFAIGGVSPVGHLEPVKAWLDPRLLDFAVVWAAGGTPHHLFQIDPARLVQITKAAVAPFATDPA